jgi:hypothetical protein
MRFRTERVSFKIKTTRNKCEKTILHKIKNKFVPIIGNNYYAALERILISSEDLSNQIIGQELVTLRIESCFNGWIDLVACETFKIQKLCEFLIRPKKLHYVSGGCMYLRAKNGWSSIPNNLPMGQFFKVSVQSVEGNFRTPMKIDVDIVVYEMCT